MVDKLLSISEAAKLLEVCENTLRDWDIEGKFKAERTEGNHRRYSLDQIRDYIEKNPFKIKEENKCHPIVSEAYDKWKSSPYLEGLGKEEQLNLALLLDSAKLYNDGHCAEPLFSSDQLVWLTHQVWTKMRFRRMVSIQPLHGPCGLIYFVISNHKNEMKIESEPVAAKTQKLDCVFFEKANFDLIKDAYADTIAAQLDHEISTQLPKINTENLLEAAKRKGVYSLFDYLLMPEKMYLEAKEDDLFDGIDLYPITTMLDPDNFCPVVRGGKYPRSKLPNAGVPIFCPYILLSYGPPVPGVRHVLSRFAWFKYSSPQNSKKEPELKWDNE